MNTFYSHNYGFTTFFENTLESIDFAAKHSLKHVEINFTKQQTPDNAFTLEQVKKIKEIALSLNITLSYHIPFTENISDIIPPLRINSVKRLTSYIVSAGRMNAVSITVHPGIFYWFPISNFKRKKALNRLVTALNKLIPVCEESNVNIVLENLVPIPHGNDFYFLGDNIEDFEYIFENIQSEKIGFCLDTGHANMAEGADKYIERLSSKLYSIHYHDNMGTNDNHMVIGEGNIDWEAICKSLIAINYSGPIISECRNIQPHLAAKKFEEIYSNLYKTIKTHQ
jgi:sugar phosphate isomerase/epimerase